MQLDWRTELAMLLATQVLVTRYNHGGDIIACCPVQGMFIQETGRDKMMEVNGKEFSRVEHLTA